MTELDPRIEQAVSEVTRLKRGHQTSGQMLAVSGGDFYRPEVQSRIEPRVLSDQSSLLAVDTAVAGMINELPIGSIIGLMKQDGVSVWDIPEAYVDDYEIIGIKLATSPEGSVFWGVIQGEQSSQQVAWSRYRNQGQVYSRKADAIEALQVLLSPTRGIETSQILSAVLSLTPHSLQPYMQYADGKVSQAGCFSHDRPKQAIPLNMLLGATPLPNPIIIRNTTRGAFVRGFLNQQYQFLPLAHPSQEHDASHALRMALIHKSQQIANDNPTNMGRGTNPEQVLEAVYSTTERLPGLVEENAPIGVAQGILYQQLGIRAK